MLESQRVDLSQYFAARGWQQLAMILKLPSEQIDPALAAYWEQCLQSIEAERLMRLASFWSSRQVLARLACACVRLAVGDATDATNLLDVTERWSEGRAALVDVWQARSAVNVRSRETEAAVDAAGAAGDADREDAYDEAEAIDAGARAVRQVLELAPTRVNDARALFHRLLPVPTHAAIVMRSAPWIDSDA